MIRYLKAKEDKKQAAEEEKRKRKEDREIKKQQREAQKQQRQKERAQKAQRKNACKVTPTECRTDPVHEEEEDIMCPACRSDSVLVVGYAAIFVTLGITKSAQTSQLASMII